MDITKHRYQIKDDLRKMKLLYPDIDFNKKYNFYYDESNNCRKFHISEHGFNVNCLNNFILAGIVFEHSQNNNDDYRKLFDLNLNLKEIKFSNIAHGNLTDCLKSDRLYKYLSYLDEKNIFVHYSSLNLLYWSLVDIVDSALSNCDGIYSIDLINSIKNAFYIVCKGNLQKVIYLFKKYKYPNVNKKLIRNFIDDVILHIIAPYVTKRGFSPELEFLKAILLLAKEKDNMPFIVDEEDGILLKNFLVIYLNLVCLYPNSCHIIDNEFSIIEEFASMKFFNGKTPVENYKFVDSKNEPFIQLSDVFTGLMAKIKLYFNNNNTEKISQEFNQLNGKQLKNINLLANILKKSEKESKIFLHNIDALSEISKMNFIINNF